MKKFIVAVFVTVVFLGCGDGGGSSSPGPVLAEATTVNAFKAYDALSVSTYLPSFIAKLRPVIANNGVDDTFTCNVSGSIDVSYKYPNAENGITPVYGVSTDIIGTYRFNKCTFDINSNDIYLNGNLNIILVFKEGKRSFDLLYGEISDGFIFKQKNPNQETDFVYKDIAKGMTSAFVASNNGDNYAEYYVVTSFAEKTLGSIFIKATIGKNSYFTDVPSGIYYQGGSAESINEIKWNDGFFMVANEDARNKMLLLGSDSKTVEVWQDDSETVFAQTENTYDTSFTSYTPSF